MRKFKVKFQPEGKIVLATPGITVAAAAIEAGVAIDIPCGAVGKCGKCKVEISEGLNEPDYIETEKLSKDELNKGMRLACRSKITGNTVVFISRTSKLQTQKILEVGIQTRVYLKPFVKKYVLKKESLVQDDLPQKTVEKIKAKFKVKDMKVLIEKFGGSVTISVAKEELIAVEKGDTTGELYGMAFDVGTTTVVGTLVDLKTGIVKATAADMNPQIVCGDDVISRLNFCITNKNGLKELNSKVIGVLNKLITEVCEETEINPKNIYDAVICGNTTMEHMLLNIDPTSLSVYPFYSKLTSSINMAYAKEFGININDKGIVKIFPVIGGWVGGDTVGVVLAIEQHKSERIKLAIDIGTNGEIVLGNKEKMLSCSCAAGPAFEGAHISCGMRASNGSIEKVDFIKNEIKFETIENALPRGFCGSGLIDAMALMVKEKIVDETGRIKDKSELLEDKVPQCLVDRIIETDRGNEFVFVKTDKIKISINQKDVREIKLAKGAMLAGIRILIKQYGITEKDIQEILIAGAFGNYIRAEKALIMGLLPNIGIEKVIFCGNAAEEGARKALLSVDSLAEAEEIANNVKHVNLSSDPEFQDEFAQAMFFEYNITN